MEDSVLSIDFGTSYTVCCFYRTGNCEFCSTDNGQHTIPSIISFDPDVSYGIDDGKSVLHHLKMLIGENFESLNNSDVDQKIFGMALVEKEDGIEVINGDKSYSVPYLITGFIQCIKEDGEKQAGRDFKDVVITVPARFTQRQRSIYIKAVEKAGLRVVKLVNEPTAAVFELLSKYESIRNDVVLVYDLGGGTFDCSLVQVEDAKTITVLFSDGSNEIGCERFDELVLEYIIKEIEKKGLKCKDRAKCRRSYSSVLKDIRNAKESISKRSVDIDVSKIISGRPEFQVTITETVLYGILEPKIKETLKIVDNMLAKVKMEKSAIGYVALIGGGSLLPIVKKCVTSSFQESRVIDTANPKEIVAKGALKSYLQHDITIKSVTYYNYSLELYNGKCYTIIPRGTPIPMDKPLRKRFMPERSGQVKVETAFYQGLSDNSSENQLVKKIEFDISKLKGSKYFYIELYVDGRDMISIKAYENEPGDILYENEVSVP